MVATMAKMARVARKENLAKIGMRSFFNKVGALCDHESSEYALGTEDENSESGTRR